MPEQPLFLLRVDIDQTYVQRLRQAFPDTRLVVAPSDEMTERLLPDAVAVIGGDPLSDRQLAAAKRLRWVQVTRAGVDEWLTPALAQHRLALTNFSGVAAPNIADHVMALIYAFARGLPTYFARQQQKDWGTDAPPTFEPAGQTLVILGLGDIGEELAKRAAGVGMTVMAMQRHPGTPPEGVDETVSNDELPDLLRTADHLALALPLTKTTTGIIGRKELALLRPTAYLYNVGRGQLVDQKALIHALRAGKLAGAGLDVTDPEPLPRNSLLWTMPNVLITGHNAVATPLLWERGTTLLLDNIARFLAGKPLLNEVDTQAGY